MTNKINPEELENVTGGRGVSHDSHLTLNNVSDRDTVLNKTVCRQTGDVFSYKLGGKNGISTRKNTSKASKSC